MDKILNLIKKEKKIIILYMVLIVISYIINIRNNEKYGFLVTTIFMSVGLFVGIFSEKFKLELFFGFKTISNILIYDNISLKRAFNKFYNFYFHTYCFFLLGFIIYICAYKYLDGISGSFLTLENLNSITEIIFNTFNHKFTWILIFSFAIKYNSKLINGTFLYIISILFLPIFVLGTKYTWILSSKIFVLILAFIIIYFYLFLIKKDFFSFFKEKSHKSDYHFNSREKIFINTKNKLELDDEYKTLHLYDKLKKHFALFKEKFSSLSLKGNYIEPLRDDPINIGEDFFGFQSTATNIYDLLNGINISKTRSSYSIGIVGEWGGGKSSIINLLEQEHIAGNYNFLLYKFNPWNYEKKELIERFFLDLGKILGRNEFSKLILRYLSLIGGLQNNLNVITNFLKIFVKEKTIEDIKEDISNYLSELNKKIIIVIDDLDRCEPEEVIVTLNLIKNLGNFQNIIYIVSYDKEHITKILETRGFDGEYLEKIINIEKYIPVPEKQNLKNFFEKKLDQILKNIVNQRRGKQIIEHSMYALDDIFEKENLRFLKRLLNQLDIVLQLNYKNKEQKVLIKKFTMEDFEKIIIINYIKLKDYNFFKESLRKFQNISKIKKYKVPNRPKIFLNLSEKNYYQVFLNLLGLKIEIDTNDDTMSITNITSQLSKNYGKFGAIGDKEGTKDVLKKIEAHKFNLNLIKYFS